MRLRISICGSTSPNCKDEDNPFIYLGDERLCDALLYVAREFPTRAGLYDRYGEISALLDNLFRVEALREESGKVYLNFTLNTRSDCSLIREVTWRHSRVLAERLTARWPSIREAILGCTMVGRDVLKYLFLSVGCFALDWASLGQLTRLGYMVTGKKQTGGTFTLVAQEALAMDMKGLYWGGHSDSIDGITLLSFGDHTGPRFTLPDVLWRKPFQASLEFDSPETRRLVLAYTGTLKRDIVKVIKRLASGREGFPHASSNSFPDGSPDGLRDSHNSPDHAEDYGTACRTEDLLVWLTWLGYVKGKDLVVPYFTAGDAPAVHLARDIVLQEVVAWAEQYYKELKSDLSDLTALKHGVDYREVFVDVWHWLFGFTNKRLAETGYIFNPYMPGHGTPGCLGGIAEDPVLGE